MPAPDGLAAVARAGNRAETLRALRDRLAAELDDCDSKRDVAALSQRLMDVLAQIAELPAEKEGTALDELARRRASGDGIAPRAVRAGRRPV